MEKEQEKDEISKKRKTKFPITPPLGNMERKHRMDRLMKKLIGQGLFVRPCH